MKPIVILADSRRMGTCRSCGAPIEWATVLASQRAMPFDPPIVVLPTLVWDDVPPSVLHVDMDRTVVHFASCPQAEAWRRARA